MATEEVKTLAGCWYTITCTAAVTVTEDVQGTAVPLAELKKAGLAVFRASQAKVTVATNGRFVVLPTEAPVAFAGGSGGGLTEEQKAELAAVAYEQSTLSARSGEGDTDMCIRWAQLSLAHEPGLAGELREVAIPCRNSASAEMDTAPRYLGLWYEAEDGSWPLLAISAAPATQVVGQTTVWPFAGVEMVPGRKYRVRLLATATGTWDDAPLVLGGRGKGSDTDGCYVNNTSGGNQSYMLELAATVVQRVAKFAPASHASDSTVHITAAEREAWNNPPEYTLTAEEVQAVVPISWQGTGALPKAAGEGGVAIGFEAQCRVRRGVAIGYDAEAYKEYAIAIGDTARVDGWGSLALGQAASANGEGGVAIGCSSKAPSDHGVAVGAYANIYGVHSVAVGREAKSHTYGVAVGGGALAADESVALGMHARCYGKGSTALGSYAYLNDDGVVCLTSRYASGGFYTALYLVGMGTPLADSMDDMAKAGLGVLVIDALGGVVASSRYTTFENLLPEDARFLPTGWENIAYYED